VLQDLVVVDLAEARLVEVEREVALMEAAVYRREEEYNFLRKKVVDRKIQIQTEEVCRCLREEG